MPTRFNQRPAAAAVLAILAFGGTATAYGATHPTKPVAKSRHSANVKRAIRAQAETRPSAPAAALVDGLAVFRRATTAQDALPAVVLKSLQSDSTLVDVNASLARRAGTNGDMFVIPGAGRTCIAYITESGYGMGCAPNDTVVSGATAGVDLASERGRTIRGVLPDGAHDVTLFTPAGKLAVAVAENGFSVEAPRGSSRLEWVQSDGTQHSLALHEG